MASISKYFFSELFISCDDVGDGPPTYEYLRHDEHALDTVGLNDGGLLCVSQYHVEIPQNCTSMILQLYKNQCPYLLKFVDVDLVVNVDLS